LIPAQGGATFAWPEISVISSPIPRISGTGH
jgi:hypothetical protein